MIFVTVGAQMPFDRLIRVVDEWAGTRDGRKVFAQVGPTTYRPRHLQYESFLEPARFRDLFKRASFVVAHAGMGSILSAMEYGKPILVMPRRCDLAETRNDHQFATARRFADLGFVHVARDEAELPDRLDQLIGQSGQVSRARCRSAAGECRLPLGAQCTCDTRSSACPNLLQTLRAFIAGRPIEIGRQAS